MRPDPEPTAESGRAPNADGGHTFTAAGGCACGEVRYQMEHAPLFVNCCHCRRCQRQAGAAFALNAILESDRLTLLDGAPEAAELPTESGRGQRVLGCPKCRIGLWSHYLAIGDGVSFIRVGTLDDPARLPPNIHIFTAYKQPWVTLPEGATVMEESYRFREHWPESSIKRWQALFG